MKNFSIFISLLFIVNLFSDQLTDYNSKEYSSLNFELGVTSKHGANSSLYRDIQKSTSPISGVVLGLYFVDDINTSFRFRRGVDLALQYGEYSTKVFTDLDSNEYWDGVPIVITGLAQLKGSVEYKLDSELLNSRFYLGLGSGLSYKSSYWESNCEDQIFSGLLTGSVTKYFSLNGVKLFFISEYTQEYPIYWSRRVAEERHLFKAYKTGFINDYMLSFKLGFFFHFHSSD